MSEYHPPSAALARLGGIVEALKEGTKIEHSFRKGGKAIFKLAGGELYYDSLLDLDSDGSRFASQEAAAAAAAHEVLVHLYPAQQALLDTAEPRFANGAVLVRRASGRRRRCRELRAR